MPCDVAILKAKGAMRLYFAGPLFSEAERAFNLSLTHKLEPRRLQNYRRLSQEAERVAAWTSEGEQARREGKARRARIKGALRAKGK